MLKIGVVVVPKDTADFKLNNELNVLKSALLYGDKVELFSFKFILLGYLIYFTTLDKDVKTKLVRILMLTLAKILNSSTGDRSKYDTVSLELLRFLELQDKQNKTKEEEAFLDRKEIELLESTKSASNNILLQFKESGIVSLQKALNSGLLSYNMNQSPLVTLKENLYNDDAYSNYLLEKIRELSLYPMFDSDTVSLLKLNELGGKEAIVTRAKQTRFAVSLFERLPNFQQASIDEILDIRTELQRPLENFRAKIIEISNDIQPQIWDSQFEAAAEDTYRAKIIPAVNEIEDACKSNTVIRKLLNRASGDLLTVMGAEILPSVTGLDPILARIVEGLKISASVYNSIKDYKEANTLIEAKPLFFYHKVGKKLA